MKYIFERERFSKVCFYPFRLNFFEAWATFTLKNAAFFTILKFFTNKTAMA